MTPTVVLITLVLHSPPRPSHQSERYKARAEVVARWRGRAKCFLDVFCSLHLISAQHPPPLSTDGKSQALQLW